MVQKHTFSQFFFFRQFLRHLAIITFWRICRLILSLFRLFLRSIFERKGLLWCLAGVSILSPIPSSSCRSSLRGEGKCRRVGEFLYGQPSLTLHTGMYGNSDQKPDCCPLKPANLNILHSIFQSFMFNSNLSKIIYFSTVLLLFYLL